MKKNLLKKIALCTMTSVLLTSTMFGCGNNAKVNTETQVVSKETESTPVKESTTPAPVDEGFTYPLDTDETLTVAIVNDNAISAICKDITETPFWKGLQERTGVKLEATIVENDNAMALLIAGGELPDIIWWRPNKYSGGVPQMIADKVLEPMTQEELDKWAPDLAALFASEDEMRRNTTTDAGEIFGFPLAYGDPSLQVSAGLICRADWLEKLDMEVPKTPEQFLDMLRAFKNEMGAEAPMIGYPGDYKAVFGDNGYVTSAFGLPTTKFYQEDGVVKYGYAQPEYKEVLKFVKTMYDEGLIPKDYMTTEGSVIKANMYDGVSGCMWGAVGSGIGTYLKENAETNPEFDLVAIGPLVAKEGDRAMYGSQTGKTHVFTAFITPQCKNKELAMKVLNYGYSEEGNMYFNFGIEGESYEMINGYPTYTEVITNNPDGLTMQQGLAQYVRAWGTGPYVLRKEYFEQYSSLPRQQEALSTWTDNDCFEYMLPSYTLTTEESSSISVISGDISTYISEMFNKFVTGEVPLDAFETEYLPTLEKLGIDKYIEVVKGAVDRYYAR